MKHNVAELLSLGIALGLMVSAPAVRAQTVPAASASSETTTDTLQTEMRLAQALAERGLQLYRYDRAAWEATDAMLRDIPKDKIPAKAAGWVTVSTAEGLRTTFYETLDDGSARGFYQSLWNDRQISGKALISPAEQLLSTEELRLIALRTLPSLDNIERCTNANLNMVILPRSAPGKIDSIYILTPQTSATAFPFGGHYRFDYRDGVKVGERKFANSCLTIDTAEAGPKGAKAQMMIVSHLLDPYPTEIHSFEMLSMAIPLAVITTSNKMTWFLDNNAGKMEVALRNRDNPKP